MKSTDLNLKTKEELIKELKILSALKANLEEEKEKSDQLQKQRDKAEKDLKLLLSLMKSINDATDLDQAIYIILETVCKESEWDLGQVWYVSEDETFLYTGKPYYYSNESVLPFRTCSESTRLENFIGLPGRVWNIKCSLWEKDISNNNFDSPRKDIAKKTGIKSQLCVPIINNGKVVLILEFLMTKHREEDSHLCTLVATIGYELSGFIWEKKVEGLQYVLSSIVENTTDAVISLTLDGKIKTWNNSAEKIYGYSASEMIGKPYTILIPEDRHYEPKIIIDKILNGEEVKRFSTIRVKKDSTKMFMSINASPIKDPIGKIIGLSKISHQIVEDRFSRER